MVLLAATILLACERIGVGVAIVRAVMGLVDTALKMVRSMPVV